MFEILSSKSYMQKRFYFRRMSGRKLKMILLFAAILMFYSTIFLNERKMETYKRNLIALASVSKAAFRNFFWTQKSYVNFIFHSPLHEKST